jgi:hypothetical protein
MRSPLIGFAAAAVLAVAACDSSGSTVTGIAGTPGSYEDISGQYSASVTATGNGLLLTGTMLITITQTKSTFTGNYGVIGNLDDGNGPVSIVLQGTIVNGKVASGTDPSVQFDLSPSTCGPTFTANTGAYGSAIQRITLSPAHIPIPPDTCTGLLRVVDDTLTLTH